MINRLDKGVIVYICDSRGVRDIYDTDGSKATAASEPLVVLVCQACTFAILSYLLLNNGTANEILTNSCLLH